jgi:hypothetical protein
MSHRSPSGIALQDVEAAFGAAAARLGLVFVVAGAFEEAETLVAAAMADARRRGSSVGFGLASAARAILALRTDDVEGAEADARAAITALSENALWLQLPLSLLVEALVERGELAEAAAVLARHDADRTAAADVSATRVLVARAELRLAQGDIANTLTDLDEVAARDERLNMRDPEPAWRLLAATAQLRAGRRDAAATLANDQLELARNWGTAIAGGPHSACWGTSPGTSSGSRRRSSCSTAPAPRSSSRVRRSSSGPGCGAQAAGPMLASRSGQGSTSRAGAAPRRSPRAHTRSSSPPARGRGSRCSRASGP